jgi:hypothetical protein
MKHLVCSSCKRKLKRRNALRYMNLPASTPRRHAAAIAGTKLSHYVKLRHGPHRRHCCLQFLYWCEGIRRSNTRSFSRCLTAAISSGSTVQRFRWHVIVTVYVMQLVDKYFLHTPLLRPNILSYLCHISAPSLREITFVTCAKLTYSIKKSTAARLLNRFLTPINNG